MNDGVLLTARSRRTWQLGTSRCCIGRTASLPTWPRGMPTRQGGRLPCGTPPACSQMASVVRQAPSPQAPSPKAMCLKDQVSHATCLAWQIGSISMHGMCRCMHQGGFVHHAVVLYITIIYIVVCGHDFIWTTCCHLLLCSKHAPRGTGVNYQPACILHAIMGRSLIPMPIPCTSFRSFGKAAALCEWQVEKSPAHAVPFSLCDVGCCCLQPAGLTC